MESKNLLKNLTGALLSTLLLVSASFVSLDASLRAPKAEEHKVKTEKKEHKGMHKGMHKRTHKGAHKAGAKKGTMKHHKGTKRAHKEVKH